MVHGAAKSWTQQTKEKETLLHYLKYKGFQKAKYFTKKKEQI